VGKLHTEPLSGFVRFLQARYALQSFVETGTYRGDATEFASTVFPDVISIEVDPGCHRLATQRLQNTTARLILGDSREALPRVVAALGGPALFWLDGHAGGGFHGDQDNCPLLEELAAIADSPFEHFVLIDDARAFLAPPPPPFDADKWPDLAQVLTEIRRRTPYYCVAIMDVLICVPSEAKGYVRAFCNQVRPRI
jgi:hypothetical protein